MFTVRRLSSPLHPLSLYSNSPDVYKVCPEGIKPWNMKNRDTYWRRHKVQESLDNNKDKASQSPASRHLGPSHSSPNSRHLPCHIFLNLFEGLKSLPFQNISVLRKSISHRAPHQGWRGQRFSQTTLHDAHYMSHEGPRCRDTAANHLLPIAVAFRVVPTVYTGMFSLTWNLMQILCCTGSVTLNVMATGTHAHSGASNACTTSDRSGHHSHKRILFHSPWLTITAMWHTLFSLY